MKKLILFFIVFVILFSSCTNAFKFRNQNQVKGNAVISDSQNTKTLFVSNAVPICGNYRWKHNSERKRPSHKDNPIKKLELLTGGSSGSN
jgi:hypothetical protein